MLIHTVSVLFVWPLGKRSGRLSLPVCSALQAGYWMLWRESPECHRKKPDTEGVQGDKNLPRLLNRGLDC